MKPDIQTDVAIIGAGSAGLYALREVRRAKRSFVLINQGPLGTTCARVGCMPSKVALHAGRLWSDRQLLAHIGGGKLDSLSFDRDQAWAHVRSLRDQFAGSGSKKAREAAGEWLLEGHARFIAPTVVEVSNEDKRQIVQAGAVIIATGSRPVVPEWLQSLGSRLITTDQLFELTSLPDRLGVLGLGAIGLEMGLAMSRLGVAVTGADVAGTLAGIADPQVAERALQIFGSEMDLWLGAAANPSLTDEGVQMQAGDKQSNVDLLLAALGRRPNVDQLNLAEAGVPLDKRGLPLFDPATMQIGNLQVFIAGDANATRPLMHEAVTEGAIAGYNAARGLQVRFKRSVPLGIAFSDPDIVTVGARFSELDQDRIVVGMASGESNGRARILGAEQSLLRIYADARDGRLLGAAMVATGGEHLAHLLAWAIQRGETVQSLLELPFYHPVIEEMLQTALQDLARHFADPSSLPPGLVMELSQ